MRKGVLGDVGWTGIPNSEPKPIKPASTPFDIERNLTKPGIMRVELNDSRGEPNPYRRMHLWAFM